MYKLFLTLRYLRKRRIAYFAIAAVMLCTAMVLIVMSVMGGFLEVLKAKARGLLGDVIIDNRSYSGFPLYDEFIADVSAWPEIEKATPVIYSFGLLRFPGTPRTSTVQVVGMRLEEVYQVNAFKSGLYYERHYPGTTSLAPQQQPLLGVDPNRMLELRDPNGQLTGERFPQPLLPEPYQQAVEQSWAAGVRDTESPRSEFNEELIRAGGVPLFGEYEGTNPLSAPMLAGDPLPGMIVGRDIIARRLPDGTYRRQWSQPRGTPLALTLVPVATTGTLETPIKQTFRYADDSRTGIYEIDSRHVYVEFELLQRLLRMDAADRIDPDTGAVVGRVPARCSQIQIKLRPRVDGKPVDARSVARRLQEHYRGLAEDPRFDLSLADLTLLGDIEGLTWEESQAHVIAPVERERQLVTILFGIISLVAGVLVLCILYMIVLQKTRDIGIIKSIGASSTGVAAIFVTYGAAIGVVGSVIGVAAGYAFVRRINDIQDFLIRAFGWRVWDRSVYSFDDIPNQVDPYEMVAVILVAVATATLGSLAAAWRAGAMRPVDALRYE